MTEHFSERTRWAIVIAFAIAMAWVEAASVFYIRALVDRIEPYQAHPLPLNGALCNVELWREAAALACVGIVLALASFMIDTWQALPHGRDAVLQVLPDDFNWPLFWVALLLMASPVLHQVAFSPTKTSVFRRL